MGSEPIRGKLLWGPHRFMGSRDDQLWICCRSIELVEVFVQLKSSIFLVVSWEFATTYRPRGLAMADGFLRGIKCGEIVKARLCAVNVSWTHVSRIPSKLLCVFPRCHSVFLLPFIEISLLLRSSCSEKVFWGWKQWLGKIDSRFTTLRLRVFTMLSKHDFAVPGQHCARYSNVINLVSFSRTHCRMYRSRRS